MANSRRVRWLEHGYRLLRQELLPEAPARTCVSVSVTTRKQAIGQHFWEYEGPDGHSFIAIHPKNFGDPIEVLRVLLHEMIHVVVPFEAHGKNFQWVAKALGFRAPWTTTPASDELRGKLQGFAKRLGPMPMANWATPNPIPDLVTIECCCPRELAVGREVLKGGNLKCMKCKKIFRRKKQ